MKPPPRRLVLRDERHPRLGPGRARLPRHARHRRGDARSRRRGRNRQPSGAEVDLEEGAYLADVGFGDGPLDPIRLVPGAFSSNNYVYGLSRADGDWWRLRNHPNGARRASTSISIPPTRRASPPNAESSRQRPTSHFVQNLFCFRHRPGGTVLLLRGRVLRTVTPQGYTDRVLGSAEDLVATLRDGFSLDLPEAAALWPKIVARHDLVMSEPAS
ncbi:MAG: arylamine N-acetyltransferase [Rhizomicrobium sp.]